MSYSVVLSDNFKKEAKRLCKKYASLKNELNVLFGELEENPTQGIYLGNNVYKIKISIASKNKGKSGGARIISYVQVIKSEVLLFSIYNKGEKDSISDDEINNFLNDV